MIDRTCGGRRLGLMRGLQFVVIRAKPGLLGHRLVEPADQIGEIGDVFRYLGGGDADRSQLRLAIGQRQLFGFHQAREPGARLIQPVRLRPEPGAFGTDVAHDALQLAELRAKLDGLSS